MCWFVLDLNSGVYSKGRGEPLPGGDRLQMRLGDEGSVQIDRRRAWQQRHPGGIHAGGRQEGRGRLTGDRFVSQFRTKFSNTDRHLKIIWLS